MTLLTKITDFFILLFECFIDLHRMTFELVGDFSYDLQNNGLMWAIADVFFGIVGIVLLLVLDAFIIYGIYLLIDAISIKIRTKKVKRRRVIGTVTDKSHKKAYSSIEYNVALKMPMSTSHPAEYNVSVEYNGISKTFDNKKVFKKYKKNDAIPLILVQNLDKNKKIIKQKLELPE